MTPCRNCGASVDASVRLCPHCGAVLARLLPSGASSSQPKLLTSRVWTDFLLGMAGQYVMHLATARILIGILPKPDPNAGQDWAGAFGYLGVAVGELFSAAVLGVLVHIRMRQTYPYVARGSNYAVLALLVIILGAFFTCVEVKY